MLLFIIVVLCLSIFLSIRSTYGRDDSPVEMEEPGPEVIDIYSGRERRHVDDTEEFFLSPGAEFKEGT